jgi:hypothetical protein
MTEVLVFEVRRSELSKTRVVAEAIEPGEGEVLARIERFAFTANNVTYAQLGDTLRYWEFFPAPEGWGRIPVWGFGDVVESRHPDVRVGERLYGFWPMASHALLRPGRSSPQAVFEGAEHRRKLPVVYNMYVRVAAEPGHDARYEDLEALFRPLFGTSFLLDDFLAENRFFGARCALLLSASGKTAFGLAYELHRRREVEVVGVTSPANVPFVERLGCYDRVVPYDAIGALAVEPTLYVDFAGSSAVREKIHARLGGELKYACAVGMSHREAHPKGEGLPGPKPVFFFAPDYGRQRVGELGREAYERRYGEAWCAFLPAADQAFSVVRGSGPDAVGRVYAEALAGRVPPERGNILSLHR